MRAVDLFSGWGGLTEGAFQAGVDVVYAANHWPRAVEIHSANHPSVEHVCQDLRQADWTRLPSYELLLAAPACQGHSLASRGKRRPYHDAMRATAWAVVDCAKKGGRSRIDAAKARFNGPCLVQHVTNHRGIGIDEPIRTITAKDQWIIVDGDRYRPLTIRELARGMGFPESYRWPDGLARWEAIRGIGNAVCPPVAREVVRQVSAAA